MTEATYPQEGRRRESSSQTGEHPPFGKLLVMMGLFVIAGAPFVAYLWETMNELLAMEVSGRRLVISIPMLLGLAVVLSVLARTVRRWTGLDRLE